MDVSQLPSDEIFERHFKILVSGSERTRGVLYFLCLVLVVNVVFFFSDQFDTSGARMAIMNGANACLGQRSDEAAKVDLPGDFYVRNSTCKYFYDYVRNYYGIQISPTSMNQQAKDAFSEKYKAILKDWTDSYSTNVPILNIKIDRNDGLILQNTLAVIVLAILAISLASERKILQTVMQIAGTDYFRIKAIIDTHVFNRAGVGTLFLIFAVLGPFFLQINRILQDLDPREIKVAKDLFGSFWGTAYLGMEVVSLIVVGLVGLLALVQARGLNRELKDLERRPLPDTNVPARIVITV
jgi:hypothetical protein